MKTFLSIWIFAVAASQFSAAQSKIKVTVFYESLCPDSVRFVTRQLYPTFKALQDYTTVELVPFGKASITLNPWSIICQHGPAECLGNAIQNCFIDKYEQDTVRMNFVNCVMGQDASNPATGKRCAEKFGYNYDGVNECSKGPDGRALLVKAEARTKKFKERLSFVPTITFNDVYDDTDQSRALKDLKSLLCDKLENKPPQCRQS